MPATNLPTIEQAVDMLLNETSGYADARRAEQRLEDERPAAKRAAILRLMQTTNDLTGKPHSASSAEAVVELDPEYADYRARQREATVFTIETRALAEAARIRAWAAVRPAGED